MLSKASTSSSCFNTLSHCPCWLRRYDNCRSCGVPIDHEAGMTACDKCMGGSHSVAPFVQRAEWYVIDGNGMIWEGAPDEPEPYCTLKDLPSWEDHPQLESYRRIPLSCLFEQLDFMGKPAGEYTCFVCGDGLKHSFGKPVEESHSPKDGSTQQNKRQRTDVIDLT